MKSNPHTQNKEQEAEAIKGKNEELERISSGSPLVSVIICTYNRQERFEEALQSVLQQDMQDMEVIVVDDGSDPPAQIPAQYADKVRLIRTSHVGIGNARAEGLDAARGSLIAYCDDDDKWLPGHLTVLVNYLQEHPEVALVYADSEWVQDGQPGRVAYSFDFDGPMFSYENIIFATDVLHRAAEARAVGGFDRSLPAYDDWDLWLRMSEKYVLRHLAATLAIRHWDYSCISAKDNYPVWDRVFMNHIDRIGPRGVMQRALLPDAAPAAPFDPDTWRPGRRELIWHSQMSPSFSFTYTARPLLLALEKAGVDITMAPTRNQPPPSFERFYKPLNKWDKLAFYYDHWAKPSYLKSERIIAYLMWESTGIPKDIIAEINRSCRLLYVPSKQNRDAYRDNGVHIPVKVLHHGVDPERFPYLERTPKDVFTFGSFGEFSARKGIDVLIRAFEDEFLPHEPVRLLLKTFRKGATFEVKDPRIELFTKYLQHDDLLEFLRRMDAFVLPSRGEGFGLAGLEAISTGMPIIATNWSGPVEYLDPRDSYPLNYKLVDAKGTVAHGVHFQGQWAEPDYEHLRYLLRYLYEHPQEVAQKGRMAAERAHKEWTRERLAIQMCRDLDEVAAQE